MTQVSDIWNWSTNVFLPNLKVSHWHQNKTNKQVNLINDFSSIIFGFVVIKQKRIKPGSFFNWVYLIENFLNFKSKIEKCSDKFTILKSGLTEIDNYYSNKNIIQTLYSTNQLCYYDYSILNEDNNDYDLSWSLKKNLTRNSTNLTESSDMDIANAFRFTNSNIKYV